MGRLLIVEDHAGLQDLLVRGLARAGIAADCARTASEASACIATVRYAAILLDRGLPDGDGVRWLRSLRTERITVPCLMLTARDALHDRIDGLEAGADDYLAKPFEMAELVARIRALMRRQASWVGLAATYGDVTIDPASAELRRGHASVTLSAAELQLMLALMRAQGAVVRRSALEAAAWGLSEPVTPNALDVALHRIRRKLVALGSRLELRNTKGIGHALVERIEDA
ncbi:MAG: response regulator transcription factor [Burkholderiaceae bacterium]|jgi:DNA-binding response OmpR family regulator|nr:response regulator transcription factor [Burkholderiales bacterium]MCZ8103649.1 response regulator transcription factor [Burkholderiales bacterium]MCZ8341366.1 response regulator transcription factor [Burkholderiaceae bacterium]